MHEPVQCLHKGPQLRTLCWPTCWNGSHLASSLFPLKSWKVFVTQIRIARCCFYKHCLRFNLSILVNSLLFITSAFEKVLNWGLGPHEDQTAEMVLILSSFYTTGLIFPKYDISWDLKVCSSTINEEISPSILLNMDLMGNGICNSRTIMNIWAFFTKCVML